MHSHNFDQQHLWQTPASLPLGLTSTSRDDLEDQCLASARIGNANRLAQLIRLREDLATCRDAIGNTPMHVASAQGHVAVVEFLTQYRPALLVEMNAQGHTPLHEAVLHGCDEVVQYLVERHPDHVKSSDKSLTSLQELAKLFGRNAISQMLASLASEGLNLG